MTPMVNNDHLYTDMRQRFDDGEDPLIGPRAAATRVPWRTFRTPIRWARIHFQVLLDIKYLQYTLELCYIIAS